MRNEHEDEEEEKKKEEGEASSLKRRQYKRRNCVKLRHREEKVRERKTMKTKREKERNPSLIFQGFHLLLNFFLPSTPLFSPVDGVDATDSLLQGRKRK